jgi:RNA polymerase sigma-70 factor (ECF subfamily)
MPDQNPSSNGQWMRAAVDRFEGPLLRYAARLLGSTDRARDVVQETFLRLHAQVPAQVEGHLAQWLFTVCRRKALDVCRQEQRMRTLVSQLPVSEADSRPGPEAALEARESIERLLALLAQLPHREQEVLRLKFHHGQSYREIADLTGLSVSNVGYLIHTATMKLRSVLWGDRA